MTLIISSAKNGVCWIRKRKRLSSIGTNLALVRQVAVALRGWSSMSAISPSHALTLTGLTPGATYHFRVTSAGGNSLDGTFTTPNSPIPTLLGGPPGVSRVAPDTVEIAWRTDTPADSAVEYGTTTLYGATVSSTTPVTEHLVTLSGLLPDTLYHFRVRSTSTRCGGATLTGTDDSFTTLPSTSGAGEVSAIGSGVPLLATKNPDGSIRVSFEERVGSLGYNLYAGDIGAYWNHGPSARNQCAVATTTSASGRLEATIPAPAADGYFLVTAFTAKGEGPAGTGVPDTESTCAP